ncbi:MAG: hypothetical protein AB8B79_13920 [Granulosicoccus sp.]
MELIDQPLGKPTVETQGESKTGSQADCSSYAVALVTSIVETACEHEGDLDLMRLINFMDLYRVYLAESDKENDAFLKIACEPGTAAFEKRLGSPQLINFEQFIGDSRLLSLAATIASSECGETVAVPAPLRLSANANLDVN